MGSRVSIVIPAFNSEGTIGALIDQVAAVASRQGWNWEVIVVNDGSTDRTWQTLVDAARRHEALTAVDLARNYGQHTALFCGLTLARGEVVVMMDDDLQHPPGWIPTLVHAINAGHDAVFARFAEVRHPWWRSPASALVGWTDRWLFRAPRDLFVSSFRAVRRDVVERLLACETPTPYVRGLILGASRSPSNVEVPHASRAGAPSGYTLRRLVSLFGRIVFAWSPAWVRATAGIAAAVVIAATMALGADGGVRAVAGLRADQALRASLAFAAALAALLLAAALIIEGIYRKLGPKAYRRRWVVRQIVRAGEGRSPD